MTPNFFLSNIRRPLFESLQKILLALIIVFLPTQACLHFWPNYSYVWGLKIDYLSIKFYLTDALIVALLFFDLFAQRMVCRHIKKIFHKNKKPLLIGLVFVVSNIFLSIAWQVSLYGWIKFIEYFLFGIYLYNASDVWKQNRIVKCLVVSLLFTVPIGVYQFINGRTFERFTYFLGERSFSISTPGIALANFFGNEFMRAYSIFPHPNVFAGYLVIVWTLVLLLWSNKMVFVKLFMFFVVFLGIIISFSKTAIFLFFVVSIMYFLKEKLHLQIRKHFFNNTCLPVILAVFSVLLCIPFSKINVENYPENIVNRIRLVDMSGKIVTTNNIFVGSGLSTYILSSKSYVKDISLLQPVHNIYLLIFSEMGLVGLVFSVTILTTVFAKSKNFVFALCLCLVLLIGLVDHYFFTLQQGQILLTVVIVGTLKRTKKV